MEVGKPSLFQAGASIEITRNSRLEKSETWRKIIVCMILYVCVCLDCDNVNSQEKKIVLVA